MPEETKSITGTIETFEAVHLHQRIGRLVQGFWLFWRNYFLFILGAISLIAAGIIGTSFPNDWGLARLGIFAGCFIVFILGVKSLGRLATRAVYQRWYARGVPREFEVTYEITNEGVTVTSSVGRGTTYWRTVNEVALQDEYWVFLTTATWAFLPRRFFPSLSAEREFIATAFARLTPEARARSRETAKWLSDGQQEGK